MPGGEVQLSLGAGASRTVTLSELEDGTGSGLVGSLGAGSGQWHLGVTANRRIQVMSLLSGPSGHLANLSSAPSASLGRLADAAGGSSDTATAAEVFGQSISGPVVQSKCIACHVEGGGAGNTRLVFERSTTPGYEALNLAAFSGLLSEQEGGRSYILNKIQGVSHGGGAQVPAGSAEFAQMERFLGKLDADVVPAAITVETLFDPVRMAPLRKTLRRAALIFAGRIPTDAEYASIYTGPTALRRTIRNMMTGPAFHDFLIRGANDRLLTNRMGQIIDVGRGFLVDLANEHHARKTTAYRTNDYDSFWRWYDKTQHGFRRAPLELIAHVVENDRPYTKILTADYIMANPYAAKAYGASTVFSDAEDPYEFKPSKITKYYRKGQGHVVERDIAVQAFRVVDPGPLSTVYPHTGILNTTSFLFRYPTTATNRNRARARWTYYHFLGVDIENSASRTMDPVALADTNNPTMHNAACTVCHTVMDPVAGAFQDYGDEGFYKDQWGGMDSLHRLYKEDYGTELNVETTSWQDRETLRWPLSLATGTQTLKVTNPNDFWDEAAREGGEMYLDRLDVLDEQGRRVTTAEFEDVDVPVASWGDCGTPRRNTGTGSGDYLELWGGYEECALRIDVEVATAGVYTAEVIAWSNGYDERYGDDGYARLGITVNAYEEGDTWYRDMRTPGFGGEQAPDDEDSLQWLARKIVADPRFAEATVKFWWPAIMGSEVAEPPAEEGDADFEGRLLAANAQGAEVSRLAAGFRQGFHGRARYNLKDLLVEIVLSKWFRADALGYEDPVREVALRNAGARRLLTPEELAHKTAALTRYQWGRFFNSPCRGDCQAEPSSLTEDFRLLYGGIDSDGITERARNVTSVMAGVAKRHAVKTSCPVVLRELYLLPDEDRKLFGGIDRHIAPNQNDRDSFEIQNEDSWETYSLQRILPANPSAVRFSFSNHWYDHSSERGRNIRLDRLDVRDSAGLIVASYELENLAPTSECNLPVSDHFALHCNGSVDVVVEVGTAGNYMLEVVARSDHAGDELPLLDVAVLDSTHSGSGAIAVRNKLVELYDKLLGVEVTPYSPEVDSAFELFVGVMERGYSSGGDLFNPWDCTFWNDKYFFREILEDVLEERQYDWGTFVEFDGDRVNAFIGSRNYSDVHYTARAWVVVLSYLLMDYRYLYL